MGGSERHLGTLLPGLAAAGHDVHMCVLAAGQSDRFTEPLDLSGVPVKIVRAGRDLNPRAVFSLVELIRSFKPDLVHTHLIHADLHGQIAARIAGVPGVSSMHSVHSFYRRQPYRSAVRLSGRLARRRIAISRHVAQFLEEFQLNPKERVRVVPYGIATADWAISEAGRVEGRRSFGIGGSEIVIGVAARLIPYKGHEFLIAAFEKALVEAPHLKLLVAGEGPLKIKLQGLANRHLPEDRFRFTGYLADMKPFIAACDVLAFLTMPELGEGFGLAALEAMAGGRAVVATRVGSLPEVVVHEKTGLLVEAGNVDSLASCLIMLGLNPSARANYGDAGHRRAEQVFSLETMVNKTVAVYEEALAD